MKYSENQKQRLLLQAEYLQNRDKDVDEKHRSIIERSGLWTEEDAARWVFSDNDTDAKDVVERLHVLLEFLLVRLLNWRP